MQSEKCRSSHVGGAVRRLDVLPIAVGQLIHVPTDTLLSGASPLPHLVLLEGQRMWQVDIPEHTRIINYDISHHHPSK